MANVSQMIVRGIGPSSDIPHLLLRGLSVNLAATATTSVGTQGIKAYRQKLGRFDDIQPGHFGSDPSRFSEPLPRRFGRPGVIRRYGG